MIDWNRALELREEMGADGFDEVLDLFLSEVEEALQGLDAVAADPAGLESALHFLKGAALNLGFAALANLCAKGEAAARDGDVTAIDVSDVFDTYQNSKAEFLAELPARAA